MKKEIKEKVKVSTNSRKKHTNKFILHFHYEKDELTPSAITLETHGTVVDAILGMVRLMEYVNTEAAESNRSITDFIGQALAAYADRMMSSED